MTSDWRRELIDEQWYNQTGDWSRNATKIAIQEKVGAAPDIYIAHSERLGYPLLKYVKTGDGWNPIIIKDSITACHTLQLGDFNNDGSIDILAGTNGGRAKNLDQTFYPVYVFQKEKDTGQWNETLINDVGIYNGRTIDYDNDGDLDVFHLPAHNSDKFYLLENSLIE